MKNIPLNDPSDLIGDLIEDLNITADEISTAASSIPPPQDRPTKEAVLDPEEIGRKRKELLTLASDGEIPKSVAYVNKASAKVIEKVYSEYEAKRMEKATEFLCDQFISKFSALLGGLEAIERPEDMEKELKLDPPLRKDLKIAMAWLTPLVPFLGLLSGGVTIGKHVWDKQSTDKPTDEGPTSGGGTGSGEGVNVAENHQTS